MGTPAQLTRAESEWLHRDERGSPAFLRIVLWACRRLGRSGARFIAWWGVLYFALLGGNASRASREYLRRVFPRVSWWLVFRHLWTFGTCVLDRVFLLWGEFHRFEFQRTGYENLEQLRAQGRGAVLVGAHLGSFEAMRALSRDQGLRINVVVHFENARRINAVLREIDPEFMNRVIEIDPTDPSFIFEIQERVEAGELVAILGDRVGLGERSLEVPFLGGRANFPAGPFTLAAALRCPVFLVFGLFEGPRRYRLFCERFADRVVLPRSERTEALTAYVSRYAQRVEHFVRLAPLNWFNFFDFWARPA